MSGKVGPLTILIVLLILSILLKNFIDANYPSETMVAGHYQKIGEEINRYINEINNKNEKELKKTYEIFYKKIQIIDNNEYKRFYNSELVTIQRNDLIKICDIFLTEIKNKIKSDEREIKTRKDLDVLYQKIQTLNISIQNTLQEYKEKERQLPLINKNDTNRFKNLEKLSIDTINKIILKNKKEEISEFRIFWYQKPINIIYFTLLFFLILFLHSYYLSKKYKNKEKILKERESNILYEIIQNENAKKQIKNILIDKEKQIMNELLEKFSKKEEITAKKQLEIDTKEKEIELKQKNLEERDKCSASLSEKINKNRNVYLNKIDVAKFEKNNLLELCEINISKAIQSLKDKNLPFDKKEKELRDELKQVLKRRPENWEPRPE